MFLDMTVASKDGDTPEVARLAALIPRDSATYARAQEMLAKPVPGKHVMGPSSGGPVMELGGVGGESGVGGLGSAIANSTSKPSDSRPSKGEPSESKPSAKAYIEAVAAAKEAARMGNWRMAVNRASEALRNSPGEPDALSALVIAAGHLGDRGVAEHAIGQLKGNRQMMLKQICASKGVVIE